jgi:AraC-like DNA-binding protein
MDKSIPEHLTLKRVRLDEGMSWLHEADGLHFLFASKGSGSYSWAGGTLPLSPGAVLRAGAGTKGTVRATRQTGFTLDSFSISRSHLLSLLQVAEFATLSRLDSHLQQPKVLLPTTFQAKRHHRELRIVTGKADLKERGRLLMIATDLLSDEFPIDPVDRTSMGQHGDAFVLKLARLSAAEMVTLRADDLAARLGCSRRHLNRILRRRFNISFAALKMEVRLTRALDFLKDPQTKVITAALECGFNHLGFFNACFRRRFGTSPSGWRQRSANPPPLAVSPGQGICLGVGKAVGLLKT